MSPIFRNIFYFGLMFCFQVRKERLGSTGPPSMPQQGQSGVRGSCLCTMGEVACCWLSSLLATLTMFRAGCPLGCSDRPHTAPLDLGSTSLCRINSQGLNHAILRQCIHMQLGIITDSTDNTDFLCSHTSADGTPPGVLFKISCGKCVSVMLSAKWCDVPNGLYLSGDDVIAVFASQKPVLTGTNRMVK